MKISIIVAHSRNRAIGKDNRLLWHLPADLKHFKNLTTDHSVVMGRKTFDSIGRPLPNRFNIVVSRQANLSIEGVCCVNDLDAAFAIAKNNQESECFVIGGAEIYALALPVAHRLYITHVDTDVAGDAYFPKINEEWQKISSHHYPANDKNSINFDIIIYEKYPQ